jgi:hypothetical protein
MKPNKAAGIQHCDDARRLRDDPAGPSVLVLPGNGKSFDTFAGRRPVCRQWAQNQTG